MKMIVAFAALVAVALAAPQYQQQQKNEVHVVNEVPSNNAGLDDYRYSFELSDGTKREESGVVETVRASRSGEEDSAILRVHGSFSWVDPADGKSYTINYVADENGFQPQGEHIPKK